MLEWDTSCPKFAEGIWTIVDRNKGKLIGYRVGDSNISNGILLMYDVLTNNNKLDLIKDRDKIINIDYLCSDGHHAYDIISNHILFKPYIKKHIISKTENKDQILENLNKEVYLFI